MPVAHCLLAAPGQDHREIRTAYSHPQALAQCRRFLERNKLDAVEHFDTAGAARMIAEDRPKGAAAIASRFAAELYGLEIIKEGIQDAAEQPHPVLRAFAREAPAAEGNKCSAVFFTETTRPAPSSGVLEVFARAGHQPDPHRVRARTSPATTRSSWTSRAPTEDRGGRPGRVGGVRAGPGLPDAGLLRRERGSEHAHSHTRRRAHGRLAQRGALAADHEVCVHDIGSGRRMKCFIEVAPRPRT
ncbi:MAG: hypothetical protein M0C28_25570 [Candidatus Moduliflexus flocculans]|nr:hypothetical protein [Candidatus Moduliflexus flocculans]